MFKETQIIVFIVFLMPDIEQHWSDISHWTSLPTITICWFVSSSTVRRNPFLQIVSSCGLPSNSHTDDSIDEIMTDYEYQHWWTCDWSRAPIASQWRTLDLSTALPVLLHKLKPITEFWSERVLGHRIDRSYVNKFFNNHHVANTTVERNRPREPTKQLNSLGNNCIRL
jgi:hypothetical protein